MAYDSVATIISRAAKQLGLVAADIADPFASVDPNIVQLLEFLGDMGREITKKRDWTVLQTEFTFPTVNGQSVYALPADFRRMIEQSGWNRTTRFPLGGPMSPQEWQYLKAIPIVSSLAVLFRPRDGKIEITPAPGATVQTIAFEYLTSFWVAVTGSTTPTKAAPTLKDDVVLFDTLLVVRAIKLAWKREKGFDTLSAEQDFEEALSGAMDDDAAAPVLNIGGESTLRTRMIDNRNVPDSFNQ